MQLLLFRFTENVILQNSNFCASRMPHAMFSYILFHVAICNKHALKCYVETGHVAYRLCCVRMPENTLDLHEKMNN